MIKPDDPAFPLTGEQFTSRLPTGMTIRTWLAGQALAGLSGTGNIQSGETIASAAVIAADRVIAKLNKGEQP